MTIEANECALAMGELLEGSRKLGLMLTAEQQDQFRRYCETLSAHNARMNLTAVRTAGGIMQTLVLDSLTIASALPDWLTVGDREKRVRVVDVGSGAGIPGLPLKIVFPWWSVALVESVGKKARFLETAVQEIGLTGVTVLPSRAEELGRSKPWRDAADLCLARAVAPLPSLIELCAPFVRPGGLLAFPKSGPLGGELDSARAAMKALRVELGEATPTPAELGLGAERVVLLYRKVAATPSGYPRRVGLARSRPIGTHGT